MPSETFFLSQDEVLQQLREAAAPVFYMSETEMPVQVRHMTGLQHRESLSPSDVLRNLLPGQKVQKVEWSNMETPAQKGYHRFFSFHLDFITQNNRNDPQVRFPVEREQALYWRRLRDVWMDHLVRQRWFKIHLSDGVNKRIIAVGQYLHIQFNPDTNEMGLQPGDWFALETGTVET